MYFVAKVDTEKCIGCKLCVLTCPDANVLIFHKEKKKVSVNEKRCKGCGLCTVACPKGALTVVSFMTEEV